MHPVTLQGYELRVKYLHSEVSGELFEKMAIRLSLVAANEGKSHVFKLLSSDIYEVRSITPRLAITKQPVRLPSPTAWRPGFAYGETVRSFIESLVSAELKFSEAIELLLKSIRFGLGYPDTYIYLRSESGEYVLFEADKLSYESSQELMAEHYNVVSKVAQYGKPIMLAGLQLQRRYMSSILSQDSNANYRSVARQLAIPITFAGQVLGVLLVEDEQVEAWSLDLSQALMSMCASLALFLSQNRQSDLPKSSQTLNLRFVFHSESETLFLNDSPFIKNLPAKILAYILSKRANAKDTAFSNQEIICALQSEFPVEGKANFEARLSLIKKRLQSKGLPMRLVSRGRGSFDLIIDNGVHFQITGYPR